MENENKAYHQLAADPENVSNQSPKPTDDQSLHLKSTPRQAAQFVFALSQTFPAFVYYMLALQDNGEKSIIGTGESEWDAFCSLSVNCAGFFILGQDTFDQLLEKNHIKLLYQFLSQRESANTKIAEALTLIEEGIKFYLV